MVHSPTLYVRMYILLLQKGDELWYAAETGNATKAKELIQAGVYVDSTKNIVSYKKVITMDL